MVAAVPFIAALAGTAATGAAAATTGISTLGAISAGLGALGTAASAYGSIEAGQQTAAADRYNAQASRVQASNDALTAAAQAGQVEQQTARHLGQQVAAYGAAGVDSSEGTPLSVMSDTVMTGELNKNLTLYRGQLGQEADLQRAALDATQARAAAEGGSTRAIGAVLTGGAETTRNLQPYFGRAGTSPAVNP